MKAWMIHKASRHFFQIFHYLLTTHYFSPSIMFIFICVNSINLMSAALPFGRGDLAASALLQPLRGITHTASGAVALSLQQPRLVNHPGAWMIHKKYR